MSALGRTCFSPEIGSIGPDKKRADEPFWVLEIRQKDKVPVAQEMLNHWGMAAPS